MFFQKSHHLIKTSSEISSEAAFCIIDEFEECFNQKLLLTFYQNK